MTRKSPIRRPSADNATKSPLDQLREAKAAIAAKEAEPTDQIEERRGLVQAVRRTDRPEDRPAPIRDASAKTERVTVDLDGLEALARMDPSELEALMDAQPQRRRLKEGQKITGVITRIDDQDLYLDVQLKAEATVDRAELPNAREGDHVDVWVVWTNGQDVELSTKLTGALAASFLEEAAAAKIPVEGVVATRNSGGFTVQIGDQTGFVPASHMDRLRSADLDSFVGKTLRFLVIETGDRAVLSRRRLQEMEMADRTESLWSSMRSGDLHEAIITSIQAFGMFVDIEGVEGLVPKSEITSDREADLTEQYTPGAPINVRVLEIDVDRKRASFRLDGVGSSSRAGKRPRAAPDASAGDAAFGTMAGLLDGWKK